MVFKLDIEFTSVKELYDRLTPALRTKKNEMKRCGYTYIQEEDIWNYLKQVKWQNATDLSLYEMVGDVLNTDNEIIDTYIKQKLKNEKRELYLD